MCFSADKKRCVDYDKKKNTGKDVACSNISEKNPSFQGKIFNDNVS